MEEIKKGHVEEIQQTLTCSVVEYQNTLSLKYSKLLGDAKLTSENAKS